MAQETVGIKIQIDGGQATQSVGSLKQQLRDAQKEVTELSAKFGATSQQAVEAAKKAAELKDAIGDAKSLTDAFNPDAKFRAFTSTLAGVAGGFAAVQGALGLVGVESDKVEKTLLKVQSAMAISQGLQTIGESIDSFKQLGAVIRNVNIFQKAYNAATIAAAAIQRAFGVAVSTTGVAFKALRAAIITTGIGALVVGIGLLINKIVEWNESSKAAADAQKALAKEIENQNDVIDVQITKLEALGGKEDEIYQKRVERIQNELRLTTEKLKRGEELNDEEIKQRIKLASQIEVLDIQEQKRKNKLAEEETKKRQENAKKLKDDTEKRLEQEKEKNKRIREASIELRKEIKNIEDELFIEEIEDEQTRNEIRLALQLEADRKRINETEAAEATKREAILTIEKKFQKDLKEIKDKATEDELTAILDGLTKENELEIFYQERNKELVRQYNEADLDATRELQQRKFEAANAGLDLLNSLAGKNEAIGNILFAVQKAIEIGKIITSTTSSISQVSASTAAVPAILPPGVPNPAYPIALGIAAKKIAGLKIGAAASIASIVASSIGKFKNGGGGLPATQNAGAGGAAPIAPTPAPQVTSTLLNAQAIQQLGNATNRAYVIESDVTNNQERIRRINRAARLG